VYKSVSSSWFHWTLHVSLSNSQAPLSDLYYLSFLNDRVLPTKTLVYFVFMFETLQTTMSTREGFKYFGSGWGDMGALNTIGWFWFTVPVMTSIGKSGDHSNVSSCLIVVDETVSFVTQIFYAWRVWIISRRTFVSIFIIIASDPPLSDAHS
jgi:hypothetical protein